MRHILIVDDDLNIISILNEIFSELGYGVLTAKNVCEAQKAIRERTENRAGFKVAENVYEAQRAFAKNSVDLVVTDIEMPGPSGLDLIDEIQLKYPKTKVIAISCGGKDKANMERYMQEAEEKGAVCFLPKPFKILDLVVMVKEVLGEKTGLERLANDMR